MKKVLLILVAIFTMCSAASAQTESKIKVINQEEYKALFDKQTGAIATPSVFGFNAVWCGQCTRMCEIIE